MAKTFIPSEFQAPIGTFFASYTRQSRDVVVLARAGCGKTTTAIWAIERLRAENPKAFVAFMAFNRSMADEISAKVEAKGLERVVCSTLHSAGLRALMNISKQFKVNQNKYVEICKTVSEAFNASETVLQGSTCQIPAGLIRQGVDIVRNRLADYRNPQDVLNVLNTYGIGSPTPDAPGVDQEKLGGLVTEALKLGTKGESIYQIDYTDMVWLPAFSTGRFRPGFKFGVVCVDEAQDLNPAQLELARRLVARDYKGRLILIGDPAQAIYGWRGADSGILDRAIREGAVKLTLPRTYRCASQIVDYVHDQVPDLVPDFESGAPHAGQVAVLPGKTEFLNEVQPGDFVIARTNAALIKVAFDLLAVGKTVDIRGRGFIKGLIRILTSSGSETPAQLIQQINAGAIDLSGLMADETDPVNMTDTVTAIQIAATRFETVQAMIEWLETALKNKESAITLSTVHRIKGDETDRVFMIAQSFELRNDPDRSKLLYVAMTRAKRALFVVTGGYGRNQD